MEQSNKKALWLAPISILAVGVLLYLGLTLLKPKSVVEPEKNTHAALLEVDAVPLRLSRLSLTVTANGVVTARTEAKLLSEVLGQVISVSDKWHDGGFFKAGETFFQLEKHQYENQLIRARASVAQTHSAYAQEQGQALVAKKEWNRRKSKEADEASRSLALREPQLASAKAQYDAAIAELDAAEFNLSKTTIVAPFDGIVLKKSADIGQFVNAGQLLGEFYAVDYAVIRIPLTETHQYLIDLPNLLDKSRNPVEVVFLGREGKQRHQGFFTRTEAILDEVTKVLYGVIEVADPYGLNALLPQEPLRIGSYVEVSIPGREIGNLAVLPKRSLRRGNMVWIVDDENILRLKPIKLLPNDDGRSIAYDGFDDDVKYIVVGSVGFASEGKHVSVNVISEEK